MGAYKMKKHNKLIASVLAFILVIGCMPGMTALAAGYTFSEITTSSTLYAGDTITDSNPEGMYVYYYSDLTFLKMDDVDQNVTYTVLDAATAGATTAPSGTKFAYWDVTNVQTGAGDGITLTADWQAAYSVTYNANGASETAPTDSNLYFDGESVPLNDGSGLSWSGHSFLGWATESDATTALTSYSMDPDNNILYAVWTAASSTYTVTYDGNGNDGGSVPVDGSSYASGDTVTVLGNTGDLTKSGYTFSGWNDGMNTYAAGGTFNIGSANVTLSAVWNRKSSGGGGGTTTRSYTLSYDGNGASSGTAPSSASYKKGATVTVSGNTGSLEKSGYSFTGWNTKSGGSGSSYTGGDTFAMGSENVVLYAQWEKTKIVYDKDKWGSYGYYNVAYSTSDGKNTIVPTSYFYEPTDSVLYKTPKAGTYDAMYSFVGFDDIAESHWASGFIWFLSARIIVNGRGNNLYVPEGNVTRAEFIKILTCMTPGIDLESTASADFLDVSPDDWYAKYVNWGAENKIVFGYGNGCFGPDNPITREQMSCMIARYSRYLGYELGEINESKTFLDQASISSWAVDDVDALQKSGLIEGDDNNMFNPQALSTRAQAAAIACRLLMGILDAMVDPVSIPCN